MNDSTIPIVDIAPLLEGRDEKCSAQVSESLHEALSGVGFLYIKNHQIDPSVQEKVIQLAHEFFAEDLSFKNEISMDKAGKVWRGFFPVGGELTSGKPDQKEGMYFGRELDGAHEAVRKRLPLHGTNLWPAGKKYQAFKSTVLSYMDQLTHLGQKLMEGVALGLGLNRNYFRKRFTDDPTILFRMFNYPKHVWEADEDEWGVREHTDMGFLTILKQDDSGGLEVKTRSGQWLSAPPIKDTFVINIGDMLEVWTHGIYRATPHRVKNTGNIDRLSLPFFFDPNWNSTLEPIERSKLRAEDIAKVESGIQKRWDGLNLSTLSGKSSYGDFVWEKVKGVFPALIKKSTKGPK